MLSTFEFCLPTSATSLSDRPNWLHEVKYDGYRMMVIRAGDRVVRFAPNSGRLTDWLDRAGDCFLGRGSFRQEPGTEAGVALYA
jgi:hypothetical protein